MLNRAAYLLSKRGKFNPEGPIKPPYQGPPELKELTGYVADGAASTVLATISERVVIVCEAQVMRDLGLYAKDTSATGVYQRTDCGHLVVLLPMCDKSKRRQRSEMWRRYWTHQVKVAQEIASGERQLARWGRCVWGQGPEVKAALKAILAQPQPVALDTETVGKIPDLKITAIGLAVEGLSVSVPWDGYTSQAFGAQPGLEDDEIRQLVVAILASDAHAKVYHNGSFDRAVFEARGYTVNGEFEDTILLMKITFNELYRNLQFSAGMAGIDGAWKDLFKDRREKLLEAAKKRIKAEMKAAKKAGRMPKLSAKDWNEIPLDALLEYNCHDAAATIVLFTWLRPRLEKVKMGAEKYDKLRKLAIMAADMWLQGCRVDSAERAKMLAGARSHLAKLVWQWRKLVGPGIPPYKPKGSLDKAAKKGAKKKPGIQARLQKLFFETHKARVIARSKETNLPSLNTFSLICWDADGRRPLADIAFKLFEIRKIQKSIQAFLDVLDGDRMHATPNVTGTLGTRLSYSDPNPQQFPKDAKGTRPSTGEKVKLAPNVRKLIAADPGKMLIEFDYSSLELLAVRYRTRNDMWAQWMAEGRDMHVSNVAMMYGIYLHRKNCTKYGCDGGNHYCAAPALAPDGKELEWHDPDGVRQVTKQTTYSRFYNKKSNPEPALKLLKSKMPKITVEYLVEVYDRFDKGIPHIANWHTEAAKEDAVKGYVETGIGGWQLLSGASPDDNRNRSFEIQSTVGDVALEAMILLWPRLAEVPGAQMLLQIHDAFVVQCYEADVERVGKLIKDAMEWNIPELWGYKNVRFPADGKYGPNWADLKPLHV